MSIRLRLACAATLLAMLPAFAAEAGEPEWIRQFGSRQTDFANAVAAGADGRVHVVGATWGQIAAAPAGKADAFVVTFDPAGTILWKRQPGTSESDAARAVATDTDGNVYVAGDTEGALAGPARGYRDAFLIKYDRDGHILWKRQPGTATSEIAWAVATDADGNVYLAGETLGAFGGTQKGSGDAFLIKYDRDGRILWKRQPGSPYYDWGYAVVTDADGNVYLAGATNGAVGGTWKGSRDAYVIKYDRDGRVLWKRQPGTRYDDLANAVVSDADGNVTLIGSTHGSLAGPQQGYDDAFVFGFDRDGAWTRRLQAGTPSNDTVAAGAADALGNIYVAGNTGGALAGPEASGRVFVLKYDPSGALVWAEQTGSTSYDSTYGAAADAAGNVYVVGFTEGDLPGNSSLGKGDAFLIKYGPNGPQ